MKKRTQVSASSYWRRTILPLIAAACSACGAAPAADRISLADTTVVRVRDLAPRDTAQLEIVTRYTLPAPANDTLHPTITALALAAGRLYAATDGGVIHQFAGSGNWERALNMPAVDQTKPPIVRALLAQADGSVLARAASGDVYKFGADGTLISRRTPGAAQGLTPAQLLSTGPDGSIQYGLPGTDQHSAGAGQPVLARLNVQGQLLDTVWAPARLVDACTQSANDHFRSGTFDDIRTRYIPSLQWVPQSDGGIVVGCNDRYELDIMRPDGQVLRITHQHTPIPVLAEEQESFMRAWTLRMRNAEPGPDWTWTGDPLPDRKPAYQRVLSSSDGRIWVWPAQASRRVPAPPQWVLVGGPKSLFVEPATGAFHVFAADGQFLGPVALSGELGFAAFGLSAPPVISGDTIWLVTTAANGVSALVRARVRWPRARMLRGPLGSVLHAAPARSRTDRARATQGQRSRIDTPALLRTGSQRRISDPTLRRHLILTNQTRQLDLRRR
jgi:hypothetical protein